MADAPDDMDRDDVKAAAKASVDREQQRVSDYLRRFESMRQERTQHDRRAQQVSDYMGRGQSFYVTQKPGQLRPRRVTSNVAANASDRASALVLAYAIDPTRPNLKANVKRGLVAAGRDTGLEPEATDYLSDLEWTVNDHMMLSKAQLVLQLGQFIQEFLDFGNAVIWTGRRRGFGPFYQARPSAACWWSVNEEGIIDTLYFRAVMPVYRVIQKWPNAKTFEGWDTLKPGDEGKTSEVIYCCQPRPGGRPGAVAIAKPFEWTVVSVDKKRILEEGGFDSFPYAVARYNPRPGQTYSDGIGWKTLPDVKLLNHIQGALENAIDLKSDPVLMIPARLFGKQLDRRPGAVNAYNPAALGLQRADQAISKLDIAGDPVVATEYLKLLTENIELAYFVDWMRLAENSQMTATQVNDRRDLRLRGMASIVANLEPAMASVGDRTLEIMVTENLIAAPPSQLAGVDVDWEYSGPLQIAQLQGQVEALRRLVEMATAIAQIKPDITDVPDFEEILRIASESTALPTRTLKSREKVAQAQAERQQQQQQADNAAKLQQLGQATRDGGAGVASLASAAQQAGQQGAPPMAGQPAPDPGQTAPAALPMAA